MNQIAKTRIILRPPLARDSKFHPHPNRRTAAIITATIPITSQQTVGVWKLFLYCQLHHSVLI